MFNVFRSMCTLPSRGWIPTPSNRLARHDILNYGGTRYKIMQVKADNNKLRFGANEIDDQDFIKKSGRILIISADKDKYYNVWRSDKNW